MNIEETIGKDLHGFLKGIGRVDERLPECPDLEELWPSVESAYLPDGVREYTGYPLVSLGWIMFVGMAFAKMWDEDWASYSSEDGATLYTRLRDAKGYDNLDDYILETVLGLDSEEAERTGKIVGECAARVYRYLQTCGVEPGTRDAVMAYIAALHRLYFMGVCMELNTLGYHMTLM